MESRRASRALGLSELPNEILSLILVHFCLHCRETRHTPQAFFPATGQERLQPSWYSLDCQALHSVCMVSTRFRDIAQPILYHQFCPGYGDSWSSIQYQWSLRLIPFLRTVTVRPDLAAQVRSLHLSHYLLKFVAEDAAVVDNALEEAARSRGFQLSEFLRPFQRLWPSTARAQYQPLGLEAAAMLLACLPNLSCLSLTAIPSLMLIPLSALKAAHVCSLPIRTLDVPGGASTHLMDVILELASSTLRTLNIHKYNGANLRVLARPLPNLRNLCITSSTIRQSDDLGLFLSHLTGIETFIYEAGKSFFH